MTNGQQQREREHGTGDNNDNNRIVDIFAHWMVSAIRLLLWQTFNYWHGYRFFCLHEQSNIHTTMHCTALGDGIGTAEQQNSIHIEKMNYLQEHILNSAASRIMRPYVLLFKVHGLSIKGRCVIFRVMQLVNISNRFVVMLCVCVCVFFRLYFC